MKWSKHYAIYLWVRKFDLAMLAVPGFPFPFPQIPKKYIKIYNKTNIENICM